MNVSTTQMIASQISGGVFCILCTYMVFGCLISVLSVTACWASTVGHLGRSVSHLQICLPMPACLNHLNAPLKMPSSAISSCNGEWDRRPWGRLRPAPVILHPVSPSSKSANEVRRQIWWSKICMTRNIYCSCIKKNSINQQTLNICVQTEKIRHRW